MEEVIKVSNLTRKYKDFSLGPVDLSFPKGFATALIGANGAGKTTLMDIICGITAKTDGTVTYFGETDNADSGNIKERIGYCASQAMFPANWKVRDIALSMSLAFDKFSKDRFYSLLGELVLSATQNAKSGKPRDKPKLSGINQHKADCYAVCCVSQVVYPARCSKVSCQKNRCVFAPIFLYLLKRRSVLNNRFKLF